MHGQGIYEYSDGAVYDGHYSDGIKCGQGTYTFKDKLQFYTGGKES
jgi:MORN repeat.